MNAFAAPWKSDPKHTFVQFSVQHLGILPNYGRFKKAEIHLDYDRQNAENSSVKVKISIKSLETDDGLMNEILVGDQFFDAQNFPYMTFTSTRIVRKSDNTGHVEGELELKGKKRPVIFKAQFNGRQNILLRVHQLLEFKLKLQLTGATGDLVHGAHLFPTKLR